MEKEHEGEEGLLTSERNGLLNCRRADLLMEEMLATLGKRDPDVTLDLPPPKIFPATQ